MTMLSIEWHEETIQIMEQGFARRLRDFEKEQSSLERLAKDLKIRKQILEEAKRNNLAAYSITDFQPSDKI